MVMPEALMPSIKKIQDTNLICAPAISQFAAVKALHRGKSYCTQHLSSMGGIREQLLDGLSSVSPFVRIIPSKGAFYILIELDLHEAPIDVVEVLIREFKIAVIPGSAFGLGKGCYLRIAFGALKNADDALERLINGLKSIRDHGIKRIT